MSSNPDNGKSKEATIGHRHSQSGQKNGVMVGNGSDDIGKDEGRRGSGKEEGRRMGSGQRSRNTSESSFHEDARMISEDGGRRDTLSARSMRRQESNLNAPPRLLVVSSKIKNSSVMNAAVLSNVVYVQYKYESTTLESLLSKFC